jgi:aspartyl-tRNA(Asn)/glutamyl-tRNA(Gln) amidotransferase subunit A
MVSILELDACELRERLAGGTLSAVDVAKAYLAQIEAREGDVHAWAWHDPAFVLSQAEALDLHRRSGRPLGRLHGLPVGLKDIIDTLRIPTENGTPLDKGRVAGMDAYVVKRLKAEGAIIMGKTVTTELAYMHPGPTANPHNTDHTPGGSSSGSAAAVAAGMVPLAIGTQTGGSIIRPAAYCGVTGFKPTFGAIPRTGILSQSPFLDTVGVFATSPLGAALLADVLFGQDDGDRDTTVGPGADLLGISRADPPLAPIFAFVRPPGWDRADDDTKEAFAELAEALGDQCFEVELPAAFEHAAAQREIINFAEMSKNYYGYTRRGRDQLSSETRAALDKGDATLARDYLAARDWRTVLNAAMDEIFERCDAVLTPAAPGPAPKGLNATGDGIFNGLWTLCGTPAVTIPALAASNGLPMGVQLVGARGNDARLLRTARWLDTWIDSQTGEGD